MGDVDSSIISVSAIKARTERQRSSSALSTCTAPGVFVIKTRCPPRVGRTQKVRELVQLALTRLRVLLRRNNGTGRSISNNSLIAYNHAGPLFSWWGVNHRVLSRHVPSRLEAPDDVGPSIKVTSDAPQNVKAASFHKATEIEKLQRLCLELLPVSEADAVPSLRVETDKAVAEFLDADFCFTTATGHGANYVALPALVGCSTVVIADESCRGAVGAGVFLGVCRGLKRFKHNSVEHLETLLRSCAGGVDDVVVVIEGLYRFAAQPPYDMGVTDVSC